MAGVFSRFSGGRSGHKTTPSTTAEREAAEDVEIGPLTTTSHIGIEVGIEFRPVEHLIEPINQDQPVRCPLLEPSILNDGRIWKEKMSSTTARMRDDLAVKKGGAKLEKEDGGSGRRHKSAPKTRLASLSAREHHIFKLLEECYAAGDRTAGK